VPDMATEDAMSAGEDAVKKASGANGGGSHLLSALTSKEILIPAAVSAAGAVAAATGPSLIRRITDSTEEKGQEEAEKLGKRALDGAKSGLQQSAGSGGIAGKMLSKALGGGGGGGSGGKKTRRLPIERWTDVAVPIDKAYDAWIKFDQYPQFMHRVQNVERKGENRVKWDEKIWFSKRQWEGRITDQRKNDRIAWKTTSGMSHKGVVSFHKIGENLTRVMVTMEFEPNGMIEKMASGMRFVKRAVQADLARYKAYVEMEDAKGIEYRAIQEDDEKDNGDSRSGRSNGGKDDAERESDRRERESRRDERRRETVGAR
jgi:carbon monoxide dehydrogenase subunit G